MSLHPKVLIKGAGEMATGVAWRLHRCHFRLVLTETPHPLAVRRAVSLCEAVHEGRWTVEGVEAVLVEEPGQIEETWSQGAIPLLVDPEMAVLPHLRPDVLVEATLSKKNTGVSKGDAPLVICLGPGYQAGVDAHYVVETNRGHNLGRLYTRGRAAANTGIPGNIGGYTHERVLRAPADGVFQPRLALGDMVRAGETVAEVDGRPVQAQIDGVLRGLIRPGSRVRTGLKVGDVDPRGEKSYLETISEKARAVAGSVLEAIMRELNRPGA